MSRKRPFPLANKENTFIVYTQKPPSPKKRRTKLTEDEIKAEQARVGPSLRAKQEEQAIVRKQEEDARRQELEHEGQERAAAESHLKISRVLQVLKEQKMTVPEFLLTFWGSKDQQYAALSARHLVQHGEKILNSMALKCGDVTDAWVRGQVKSCITVEARHLSDYLRPATDSSLSESLSTFSSAEVSEKVKDIAPMLWGILEWAGSRGEGEDSSRRDRSLVRDDHFAHFPHTQQG